MKFGRPSLMLSEEQIAEDIDLGRVEVMVALVDQNGVADNTAGIDDLGGARPY